MMKITVLAWCLVAAWAAPAEDIIPIVSQESDVGIDGKYHFSYESADGTKADQDGELQGAGEEVGEEVHGSYEFKGDDGQTYHVEYTAGKDGYVPVGDHIPGIPEPIARALKWAEEHPYKEENQKH